MIHPVRQPDLIEQFAGAAGSFRVRVPDQRRNQHVFQHGTLRQQAVVLENEADLLIAEGRQFLFAELVGIGAVERNRSRRRWLQAPGDVEQGALARAGWAHDGRRLAAP